MSFYRVLSLLVIFGLILFSSPTSATQNNEVFEIKAPSNCLDKNIVESEELSLIELIKIGICNNPSLASDYMLYQENKDNLSKSKKEYYPQINLTSNINKNSTTTEGYNTNSNSPYNINLGLSMLLYDFGGRSARIDSFKSYLSKSGFEYNNALQDLILSIHTAYFKLLGAQEDLISAKANEAMYKKTYDEAKRKYDVGLVALNDKLQTQTTYEQSKLKVIETENNVKQYQGDLAVILNLSPKTTFKLKEPPKDRDLTALDKKENIDTLIEQASLNRLEIQAQKEAINQANADLRNLRASRYGSFNLSADSNYSNTWKYESSYKRDNQIGIQYRLPLFTGFDTKYSISATKKKRQRERYILDEIKNNIKNEVWSAYHNYKTSLKSYDVSKKLLKSAEENEKVAFKSYEIGKTDIINLLTAESQLAQARDTLVNSFYTVLINKATLYRSIGRF